MPIVPTIEVNQRTSAVPVVTSRANISAPLVSGNRLSAPQLSIPEQRYNPALDNARVRMSQTIGSAVDMFVENEQRKADRTALLELKRGIADFDTQNVFDKDNGMLARKGKAAFDNSDVYGRWDKYAQQVHENLPNQTQKDAFSEMALNYRNDLVRTGERISRSAMDDWEKQQTAAVIAGETNRAIQYGTDDPEIMLRSIQTAQDTLYQHGISRGMPEAEIRNKLHAIESTTLMGVLQSKADSSPQDALDFYSQYKNRLTADDLAKASKLMRPVERGFKAQAIAAQALSSSRPVTNRDEAINYVMNELEGGDAVVSDGNGIAKFGINSAANPDVDVKNLTADQARAIYRAKYWDAVGAEGQPADMRLVAFDTAVNHGLGKAKELIEASGGDPRKLIELRAAEYSRLANENPEKYGKNYDGWINRLGKLQGQVDALRGRVPNELEVVNQINGMTDDPDVAKQAQALAVKGIKTMTAGIKASEQAANLEAMQYVRSGSEVPPSVEARMNPKDVRSMRSGAPANPQVYEKLRSRIIAGEDVQLADYVWQLGGKYDDLVNLQQKPEKRPTARKVDDVIKNASKILLGKPSAKTEEDFTKIETFRRAVDNEIEALEKSGKRVEAGDVEKITDRLLLSVDSDGSGGLFGSDKRRMYEIGAGQEFEVEGIPSNSRMFIAGEQVEYSRVIDTLSQYLENRNVRVTPEALGEAYNSLVKSGKLVVNYE